MLQECECLSVLVESFRRGYFVITSGSWPGRYHATVQVHDSLSISCTTPAPSGPTTTLPSTTSTGTTLSKGKDPWTLRGLVGGREPVVLGRDCPRDLTRDRDRDAPRLVSAPPLCAGMEVPARGNSTSTSRIGLPSTFLGVYRKMVCERACA